MLKAASHCCLCGLLCSLETDSPTASATDGLACSRRRDWLSRPSCVDPSGSRQWQADLGRIAELFSPDRSTLIWLESADVATVRAAVAVAQASRTTVHVGSSTGAELIQRVMTSEGWLGATLAEVVSHADTIVTLGAGIVREAPLLSERFLQPAVAAGRARWTHITTDSQAAAELGASHTLTWPRAEWYARLTELLWSMQPNGSISRLTGDLAALRAGLQQSQYSVWLWEMDEFCDAVDELIVRRLLGISRRLSVDRRCSLLCLDSNVGRVTALETLLWLTGCHATARYTGDHWMCEPNMVEATLNDWQDRFDSILMIRSLPGLSPLPNLTAAHYLIPAGTPAWDSIDTTRLTRVAAVSVDSAGHVFRGDRATTVLCTAGDKESRELPHPTEDVFDSASSLPTAAQVLAEVGRRLQGQEVGHAH
jgi:hypothetical protein